MAIVKFCNGKSKGGLKSLKNALRYIDDADKTLGNPKLVGGIARNAQDAWMRMTALKRLWHKTDGRQYIHSVFAPKGCIADNKMLSIAKEIQKYFSNYVCFYAIHKNRPNTHTHFILNSVGLDGRKFNQSKADLKKFKKFIESLCEKYDVGLSEEEDIVYWASNVSNWQDYIEDCHTQNEQYIDEYRPHINDIYMPVCYRREEDGNMYPINPMNEDGSINMIQVINPETDKVPMIHIIGDDGYLKPGF